MKEQEFEYDPEVEEIDVEPFEGEPDYDQPQGDEHGRQDDEAEAHA